MLEDLSSGNYKKLDSDPTKKILKEVPMVIKNSSLILKPKWSFDWKTPLSRESMDFEKYINKISHWDQ